MMQATAARPLIRRARPEDRLELRSMQALSLRVLAAGFYTAAQIEAFLAHVGTMDDFLLHEGTYYVALEDGAIVASGGWSRSRPNYANATGPAGYGGSTLPEIRSVFVHPAWARRGLARCFVERAEHEAATAGHDEIELTATLAGAALYDTLGYRAHAHVPIALPDGGDITVVVMRKTIRSEPAMKAAGGLVLD